MKLLEQLSKSEEQHYLAGILPYYTDRSAIFDALHTNKLDSRSGLLTNTMVLDGQVVGTWKRTFKKNAVVIEANPFTPLSNTETRAFAASAKRFGAFLRMPVDSPWQKESRGDQSGS